MLNRIGIVAVVALLAFSAWKWHNFQDHQQRQAQQDDPEPPVIAKPSRPTITQLDFSISATIRSHFAAALDTVESTRQMESIRAVSPFLYRKIFELRGILNPIASLKVQLRPDQPSPLDLGAVARKILAKEIASGLISVGEGIMEIIRNETTIMQVAGEKCFKSCASLSATSIAFNQIKHPLFQEYVIPKSDTLPEEPPAASLEWVVHLLEPLAEIYADYENAGELVLEAAASAGIRNMNLNSDTVAALPDKQRQIMQPAYAVLLQSQRQLTAFLTLNRPLIQQLNDLTWRQIAHTLALVKEVLEYKSRVHASIMNEFAYIKEEFLQVAAKIEEAESSKTTKS